MTSRRGFLLGAASAAAGAIDPYFFERALAFVENRGEPLLEGPRHPSDILYANMCEDQGREIVLTLGAPFEDLPSLSYDEFYTRLYGSYEKGIAAYYHMSLPELLADPELEALEASCNGRDDEVPMEEVMWAFPTPERKAFELLSELDLGPWGRFDEALGSLRFIDCESPGSSYTAVHAANELTLSCLQRRLDLLGTGLAVRCCEAML